MMQPASREKPIPSPPDPAPRRETRRQKLQRIRRQIRQGRYEQEQKIDAILDRVAADLNKMD